MATYLDNFTPEELAEIVADSVSMREVARKVGYQSIGDNEKTIKKYLDKYNISTEHFTGCAKEVTKRTEDNVFIENSTASQATLRRWYKKGNYTEYKCAICGQEPFWNGKKLVLTLDHINGHNHDDRLENLRWVCPNCDRQLPTYGNKNNHNNTIHKVIKKIKTKPEELPKCPPKDELYNILISANGNFEAVGRQFDVSGNAVRKWCKKYNMPSHTADYKTIKEKKGVSLPSQKVEQWTKDGQYVATFESISSASRITGIFHIGDASNPNNPRQTAGGYIWKRINQEE